MKDATSSEQLEALIERLVEEADDSAASPRERAAYLSGMASAVAKLSAVRLEEARWKEAHPPPPAESKFDMSRLTLDELKVWRSLILKAAGEPPLIEWRNDRGETWAELTKAKGEPPPP